MSAFAFLAYRVLQSGGKGVSLGQKAGSEEAGRNEVGKLEGTRSRLEGQMLGMWRGRRGTASGLLKEWN
jgi:hypothetical protein